MTSLITSESTRVDQDAPRLDRSELPEQDTEELLRIIGLHKKQTSKLLTGFRPRTSQQSAALKACLSVVEQYPRVERGLILIGPTGTGKTHLMAATIRAMLEKEQAQRWVFTTELRNLFCWYDVVSLVADYREAGFSEKRDMRHTVRSTKILVLDDLGTENGRDFALDILFDVINYRYEEGRPTFLTANATPEELAIKYGDRFLSRFGDSDSFQRLLVQGPDHRKMRDI